MKTRNKILAGGGLLGSALLAVTLTSPGTLATWGNEFSLDAVTIDSGNLEVAALGNMAWSDSSDPANPVNIDLNTYKIVPGDTLTSEQNIDMALEGDNILASFDLDFALASSGGLLDGLTITYDVVDENGVVVIPETSYDTAPAQIVVNASDVTPDLDNTKDYVFRTKVVFPNTTENRDYTEVNSILNSAQVKIKQVLDASSTGTTTTTPVSATLGYKLALGYFHTLAVQSDGTVKSWGRNNEGQLGITTATRSTPIQTTIPNLSNVKDVYVGYASSIAVLNDGSVYGWGQSDKGQLGLSLGSTSYEPRLIPISNVKQIEMGFEHTLALLNDGTVLSTGNNTSGELGLGDTNRKYSFTVIPGLSNISEIEVSARTSFAKDSSGNLMAWGKSSLGQTGTGSYQNKLSPVSATINDVKEINCAGDHCFATKNNNEVYGWGYNYYNQLAINGTNNVITPTLINTLGPIEIITPFHYGTYIKTVNGNHYLWGRDIGSVLGNGPSQDLVTPTLTSNIENGDTFLPSKFGTHVYNKKADNSWTAWGYNTYGQLGLGTIYIDTKTPVVLSNPPV